MTTAITDRLDSIFARASQNRYAATMKQELSDRLKAGEFDARIQRETELMHRWDALSQTRDAILQEISDDKRSGTIATSMSSNNHPPFFRSAEFTFSKTGSHERSSHEIVLQPDGKIQLYADGIAAASTDIDAFAKGQTDYLLGEFARFVGGEEGTDQATDPASAPLPMQGD